MRRGFRVAASAFLCATFAIANAWAQPVPGGVAPGQIERQFKEPPEPRAKPGEIRIPAPAQKPPSNAEAIRFLLKQLTVEGVTVYPAESIRTHYENLLGKEVALADIYRVAESLTARYRNDGYILSQVVVPAQSVEDGTVRLQAMEGYVANVRVEGSNAAVNERAARFADKIKAQRPLTAAVLERYLLLINDIPGTSARAVLAPSATDSGASDLVVQVTHQAVTAGLTLDNRGSRALGPLRLLGDAAVNYTLGQGARTGLRFVTTGNGELNMYSLSHDQLIGTEGGKIGLTATAVRSKPQELAIIPLNLETSSNSGTIGYSHPVIRSRQQNLYLRGTLSGHDGETRIFGVRDTEDRIRALRFGVTYDIADATGGVSLADVEFSHGLRALGASANGDPFLSRANGKVDFSKLTLYAARRQPLVGNWSAFVAVNAQYAFTDLLVSELFSFGGDQFGRGYDPSELVGDHGAALKAEIRYSGTLPASWAPTYTAYAFYDIGQIWQRTATPGFDATTSAASTGIGLRLNAGRYVSGVIEVAKPLTRTIAQEMDRKARAYAGLTIRY